MAAGDFSASVLPDVIIKLNEMNSGARFAPELDKDIDTIMALATRQTAKFEKLDVLLDVLDCRGAKVTFLKACADTAVDIIATPISDCALAGAELESASLTLANNIGWMESLKVLGSDCKDAYSVAEKIASGMAAKFANLEHKANLAGIAFLAANEQAAADPGDFAEVGNVLQVPEDEFNPELLADMAVIAKLSKLYNPFIISGSNLYVAQFLSDYVSPSTPNTNAVLKAGPFDIVFDIQNIDSTLASKTTFLVDPSSYVFWTSNQYEHMSPQPMYAGSEIMTWKQRAPRLMFNNNGTLTPVYFDVESQESCEVVNGVKYVNRIFNIFLRGGLQLGPQVCDADATGIIQFDKIVE